MKPTILKLGWQEGDNHIINLYYSAYLMRRKTGVTLKDTGIRDEHGLEPIDGIFSSPEKGSPVRKANGNGNGHGNSTLTDGEMEIGESAR